MTSEQENRNARTAARRKLLPLGEHAAVGSGRRGAAVMGETATLGWLVVDCCHNARVRLPVLTHLFTRENCPNMQPT